MAREFSEILYDKVTDDETGVITFEPHVHTPHKIAMTMAAQEQGKLTLAQIKLSLCTTCRLAYYEVMPDIVPQFRIEGGPKL